jgi:hypothetical protein
VCFLLVFYGGIKPKDRVVWNFATVIFSYTMMTDEARASRVMMSNVLMIT